MKQKKDLCSNCKFFKEDSACEFMAEGAQRPIYLCYSFNGIVKKEVEPNEGKSK